MSTKETLAEYSGLTIVVAEKRFLNWQGCTVFGVLACLETRNDYAVFVGTSQVSALLLILASTLFTVVGLLTLLFFLFRWLDRPIPARKIQMCPRCGNSSVKVSLKRTAIAGTLDASMYCRNCGQYSTFQTEEV